MWHRRKSELEQLKCHPGAAKDFLRNVDDHLYQISLEKVEEISLLTLEQDYHTSGDGFECYLLAARKEGDYSRRFPMPVLALQIMGELLHGLTVFTDIHEAPVPRRVVEELANYRVSPHMFSASYARFYSSHPTEKERVFFNGSDSVVTVTNGMNRALLETLYMTPGYDNTLSALQCGVAGNAVDYAISGYDEAKRLGPEKCHIWMNYHWSQLLIGIQWSEEAERQLISKLQLFCLKHGIELRILWPYE